MPFNYITKLPEAEHEAQEWQAVGGVDLGRDVGLADDVRPDWRHAGIESERPARV
jgi:hypothetical protein